MRLFLLLAILIPASLWSQQPVELYLGDGHKAFVTPPSGWRKGTGFGDEACYWKQGNEVGICIKTRSKDNKTAPQILDAYINDLSPSNCEFKENKQTDFHTAWKECQVKVGPRTEGRIWTVISYKNTRYAIVIDVYLQRMDSQIQQELLKMLDGIRFFDPQ